MSPADARRRHFIRHTKEEEMVRFDGQHHLGQQRLGRPSR
jgi:hypothetical protein